MKRIGEGRTMFEIVKHDDGIIEICYEGHFSAEDWEEYKVLMTKCLDEADGKICILSDFSKTPSFDAHLVKDVSTAKHLSHPNLGFLMLLGGNSLHNFIFSLASSRAMQENKDLKLRIERDREKALDTLRHFQSSFKPADKSEES
jgi:hypothetical protein